MSGDRCPDCHADWDGGPEHWHVEGCPRAGDSQSENEGGTMTELQDAIREWLTRDRPKASMVMSHLPERLERLLRRVDYSAFGDGNYGKFSKPQDDRILAALKE